MNSIQRFFYCGGYPADMGSHRDQKRFGCGVGVLGAVAVGLIKRLRQHPTPITIMGLMVFVMLICDTLGTEPSKYPFYQIFVWGMISLSFQGIDGLESSV